MDQNAKTSAPSVNNPEQNVIHSGSAHHGSAGHVKNDISKSRLFAIAGAAAIVVLGTIGYLFGYYLPNKPENVFQAAVVNTGKGYDSLVEYLAAQDKEGVYDAVEFDGSAKLEASGFSMEGSFDGSANQNEATFSGELDLGVMRLGIDSVVSQEEDVDYPDVYFKLSGIEGLGAYYGVPALDLMEDQWVLVDHDLISSYSSEDLVTGSISLPSQGDVISAAEAISETNKKYLFSNDPSNAVFQMDQYEKEETIDDVKVKHYKAKINKSNYRAYLTELGKQLDDTDLNNWLENGYGKSFSELLEDMDDDVEDGERIDVWVNSSTKLIYKIRLTETEGNGYLDIGLDYADGDEKPFFLNIQTTEDDVVSTLRLSLNVNTKTGATKIDASLKDEGGYDDTDVRLKMSLKPVKDDVGIAIPADAITLSEAMANIGLGGYLDLMLQDTDYGSTYDSYLPYTFMQ